MPQASIVTGLSNAEVVKRLKQYGPNEIVQSEKMSVLMDFLVRFKNPLILILIAAATLSYFLGELVSALIIIAMVILSVIVDFINTYKSKKAVAKLKARVMITATVIRDSKQEEVLLKDIVPGDTVLLEPGDIIPADGKIIQAKDFFVNESSLTGESFPNEKEVLAQVFMGSSVVTGDATMIVQNTGQQTKFSHIAEALVAPDEPTEFDNTMKDFSMLIMKLTTTLVIFIFLINLLFKRDILESFLFAVALAVGLTPEFLPMIIALNLSKGSIAMGKRGVIVKKLSAIQNFGSMDILCTDKTGTLTEDKIALMKYTDGFGKISEPVFLYAYLNSLYTSGFRNPLDSAVKEYKQLDISQYEKIDEIPFDYERRRASVVVSLNKQHTLLTKGAPEEMFLACSTYGQDNKPLSDELHEQIMTEYKLLSKDGFRVLAVAKRDLSETKTTYSKLDEKAMTFMGFIAFLDPPKKLVEEALKRLENYGIEIKILTGDNELVSQKIAHDINLPIKGIMLGEHIDKITDQALFLQAQSTTIFARVTPEQKQRIIKVLKSGKFVVGYLGDGINDAPSLKIADVGISVNNAVDVAKETADLILINKDLGILIEGVIDGRKTFANTLKYLMMGLSSNFGNMFSMAGASLFLPFLPMLPGQILLNNFLYDSSEMTIPLDNVDHEDIIRPRKFDIKFLKKFMIVFGSISSVFDFLTFGLLFFVFRLGESGFQTGWFLESIATQTLVVYIIRTRRLPFLQSSPSKALFINVLAAVAAAVIIVLITPLRTILSFTLLPVGLLLAIVGIVIVYLLMVEVAKRWFYKHIQI